MKTYVSGLVDDTAGRRKPISYLRPMSDLADLHRQIAELKDENQRLRVEKSGLAVQLQKARKQRFEAYNQLRSVLSNRRREDREAED